MKKIFVLGLVIALLSMMSACDYKAIDDALHSRLENAAVKLENDNEVPSGMEASKDPNTGVTAYTPSYVQEDQIEFKEIGETFPDREHYMDGFEYTMNGYTYYESFADSGIDREELTIADDEYYADILASCGFYLIDMTLQYTGTDPYPEDAGEYPVYCALLPAVVGIEETLEASYPSDEVLADGSGYTECVYQSMHPPLDNPETDRLYWYFPEIEPGESIDFQIGMLCTKNYVRENRMCLCVGHNDVTQFPTVQYFALFDRGEGR